MKTKHLLLALVFLTTLNLQPSTASAQGTAFTYQGFLTDQGGPANGVYDLEFRVFDAEASGMQQGGTVTVNALGVTNGLFTATLNPGAGVFTGVDCWLETGVRTNGVGLFAALSPRQKLTPTPYAVYAPYAGSAVTATTAASAGSVSATNIAGVLTTSQLPAAVVTNGAWGVNLSGTFSGGFGAVTNLNLSKSLGGLGNRLRFNDTVGAEQVWLHAAKNMDMETVNDVTFWAGHDVTATVDHDTTLHVKHDASVTVDNNLSIRSSGGVRLSDDTPNLSFGANARQMLNLWGSVYGVGVQAYTLYSRSDGGFAWFRNGTHSDTANDPGGGTRLMTLDGVGELHVGGGIYAGLSLQNRETTNYVSGPTAGERWVWYASQGICRLWSGSDKMSVNNAGTVTAVSFNPTSDRNLKENFRPVDGRAVLDKVAALPLTEWNYKSDTATRHVGPMAQDFYAAFGVGPDDKHIATVDADGVALAAIQGLNEKVEARSQKLEAENAELKTRLEKLEKLLQHKLDGVAQ